MYQYENLGAFSTSNANLLFISEVFVRLSLATLGAWNSRMYSKSREPLQVPSYSVDSASEKVSSVK
jgi:hypothetical protein